MQTCANALLGTGLTPIYSTAQPVLVPDYTEVTDERLLNPEAHNWLPIAARLMAGVSAD